MYRVLSHAFVFVFVFGRTLQTLQGKQRIHVSGHLMNKVKRNDKLREVGLQRLTGDFRAKGEGEDREKKETLTTNAIGNVIGGIGKALLLRRKKDSFEEEFGVPGMTNQIH